LELYVDRDPTGTHDLPPSLGFQQSSQRLD
jgi:hypothetical protein